MSANRPFVLSIAGFDPSGGAGVLADIKTFETHGVYGLGVCTSLTFQNESEFEGLSWISVHDINRQISILMKRYDVAFVKIGLVQGLLELDEIINCVLFYSKGAKLLWDPILQASAGYSFHSSIQRDLLSQILKKISLLTPNLVEAKRLGSSESPEKCAEELSEYCAVFLKGGHRVTALSEDILFQDGKSHCFYSRRIEKAQKHGSGCVLSSSIIAHLAKGATLQDACNLAKVYTAKFLTSHSALLGYHASVD